ncbi:MAG: LysR family transcriptional regulator [Coriobacteriia bacterium]|nr:LysR family transcriptional regulator [Coriobacteriia bacterium]
MNLSHLYYFRKLIEVGSYSVAAKELFVARPTLSLAVSGLEKELGVPLLKKKRHGIELTEDGEEFYTAVLTATNVLDSCISEIQHRAKEEYSSIKIGVVYSVQSKAWSNLISEFRRVTGVDIELRQGITSSLLKDLKSGELDVIFSGLLGEGDSELVSIPCFTQRAALVVNKNHPLAQFKEVKLSELSSYNVFTYLSNEGPFAKELNMLFGGAIPKNVRCGFSDELPLCSMVVADPRCVAIVAYSWLVDSFPDLVTLEISEAPEDFHQFYMSYRRQGRKPLAVKTFIDLARGYSLITIVLPFRRPLGPKQNRTR